MEFKAAVCPNCGGQLQVPDDKDYVKCMYCGTDINVRQVIKVINTSNNNLDNYINLGNHAIQANNYEEAYSYFSKVLEIDMKNYIGWLGRGISVGFLSDIGKSRISEARIGFENAINYSPDDEKKSIIDSVVTNIHSICDWYFSRLTTDVQVNGFYSDNYNNYLVKSEELIKFLEFGHNINPVNAGLLKSIISICRINLEGIGYNYEETETNQYGAVVKRQTKKGVRRAPKEWKEYFTNKMNLYSNKLQSINPNFQLPKIKRQWSTNETTAVCCLIIIVVVVIFALFYH